MANELKHSSVGTELTQAEWEAVDGHVVNSQAVGDLIYAETTSSLQRLGIGSANDVLRVTGGKPDWQATSFITSLGTIATGVWQGTDVGVAYGGTGVSTLTDGGVLLGSGASAITAMAVLTDGQMIVGNGSTDPVAESGATLRTSIGVGTGDTLSLTGLTLSGSLTSGSITSGFGNIDNGSSTLSTGAATATSLSLTDGNITNVADIALDTISPDGTNINFNFTGILGINETANTDMTTGLTINQAGADNTILAFKSSDVNHGVTAQRETDTYGDFRKRQIDGGLRIRGLNGVTTGVVLDATGITENTAKTTSALGYIELVTTTKDGTGIADPGTNTNLVVVSLGTTNTVRFILDAEGSGHADVEWTTYATHDDLSLVADIESELLLREDEAQTERRHMLEEIGIIGEDSWHMENGKPRAMVNMTKLSMLHHGALMQAAERIEALETKLLAIEGGK